LNLEDYTKKFEIDNAINLIDLKDFLTTNVKNSDTGLDRRLYLNSGINPYSD